MSPPCPLPDLQGLVGLAQALGAGQYKPNQTWLIDMLQGMAISRSVVLMEIARALDERTENGEARKTIHTEKRISWGLCSARLDDALLRDRYLEKVAAWIGEIEAPVIVVGMPGLPKIGARTDTGMEGVGMCWAGDTFLGVGYAMLQLCLCWNGHRVPFWIFPFDGSRRSAEGRMREGLKQIAFVSAPLGCTTPWQLDETVNHRVVWAGFRDMGIPVSASVIPPAPYAGPVDLWNVRALTLRGVQRMALLTSILSVFEARTKGSSSEGSKDG